MMEDGAVKWVIGLAPPGVSVFEFVVADGKWKRNDWTAGNAAGVSDMEVMDEIVVLTLRYPSAEIFLDASMDFEQYARWLEYALHRLRRGVTRVGISRAEVPDETLQKWGYCPPEPMARDAVRVAIAGVKGLQSAKRGAAQG